jgi:hypothetical protein
MTRREYEDAFGTAYRKPGILARFVTAIFKVVPKFGPLKPLAFEPLTPETERMFLDSFTASCARYRALVRTLEAGQLALGDVDLDTGNRSVRGANPLADATYAELLAKLAGGNFAGVPSSLRKNINDHYASRTAPRQAHRKVPKVEREAARHLATLNAAVVRGR